MDIRIIKVKDFSITPGSRHRDEGEYSGEEFRETILEPIFKKAVDLKMKVTIDLDGTIGYGTSWLEEVFGGLTRKYSKELVNKHIEIISNEEPYLKEDINEYIEKA